MPSDSKTKLLEAAVTLVKQKGYAETRIEDVCAAAGLTKGSFFHHFKNKEDLGLSAADHWQAHTDSVFADAPYHRLDDPLERLLAYIDFRQSLIKGTLSDYTCFAGTVIQDAYQTHPEVAHACASNILDHATSLESDIRRAASKLSTQPDWEASSLALHIGAVVQGAFIMAKAQGCADGAIECLQHLRRYVELLFKEERSV